MRLLQYFLKFSWTFKVKEICTNSDNGATDGADDSCEDWYDENPDDCGEYDDDDFTAKTMCCACKTIGN